MRTDTFRQASGKMTIVPDCLCRGDCSLKKSHDGFRSATCGNDSFSSCCKWIHLLCLALSLLLFLPACKGRRENAGHAGGQTVKAAVAVARMTAEPRFREALGTVRAEAAGVIAARTSGTVTNIKVREGDRVREGDLLLTIDDPRVREQLRQTEAAENEAREAARSAAAAREAAAARAELAAATFRRFQSLIAQGAVSRQEFDQTEAGGKEAAAARSQAEKAAEAANARLSQAETATRIIRLDTEVRAPYDGTVTARLIEAGSLAAPGTPLVSLERTDAFRADVSVPEGFVGLVTAGDKFRIAVPDAAPEPFAATVLAVEPASDPQTRTVTVQMRLPESPALRSGMFARAFIPAGETKAILVPESALVRQGQLTCVFVVDSENHARFRLVRPGAAAEARVEILAGLRDGERFVVHPPAELTDGSLVEAAP